MSAGTAIVGQAKLGNDIADITHEDLEWCVRGGSGEGLSKSSVTPAEWRLEHRALASCFVQRWMYLRARSPAYRGRPLGYLAQYHSVPINPTWLPGGTNYERWKGRDPQTTPERVAARIARRSKPLSQFDPELVAIYRDTFSGRLPLVESGHDWGAVTLYDGSHGLDYSTKAERDRTGALAVPHRDNARVRPKTASYVAIPGQHRRGNVFSTFSDASYAEIVGGAGPGGSGGKFALIAVAGFGAVLASKYLL